MLEKINLRLEDKSFVNYWLCDLKQIIQYLSVSIPPSLILDDKTYHIYPNRCYEDEMGYLCSSLSLKYICVKWRLYIYLLKCESVVKDISHLLKKNASELLVSYRFLWKK